MANMGDSKDVTRLQAFMATLRIPGEVDRALEQTKHAVSRLSRAKHHGPRRNLDHFSRGREGAHRIQCVHSCCGMSNRLNLRRLGR